MPANKPIAIVGGGLAGLTLGIGLRQRAVPVTVWESGHYPRHRVCGEFISGKGQGTLRRLGLSELLARAGAIPARTTAFFSPQKGSPVRELSEPAVSISRYALDALLAEQFRQRGGELREDERWRGTEISEGVVRASGRRAQPVVNGWRWFGLKAHARRVELAADLEMHLSPSGYLGMCRLKDGEVNVCGLFRRRAANAQGDLSDGETKERSVDGRGRWQEILSGAPGSRWHERLAGAEFDSDSFCSVAGLSLEPQRALASNECCVGDTITMIAPVTGNGMSMAFESAEMAVEPLAEYSGGKISWSEAQRAIARRCDKAFARRLAWAAWLQRLMFMPRAQNALVLFAPRWLWMWKLLLERTR